MKILITNTVALNGGDAAILLSIIHLLKNEFGSEIELVIYDSQPEIARLYYPSLNLRKLIYIKETQVPPMKFLGRSLFGRGLRRLFSDIFRFLLKINPPRFYFAAWCWKQNIHWIHKLLVNADELQDIKNYHDADLIVSTGGTYLVEHYSPLTARIFDYDISNLMEKPLVFFTQSLGPFTKDKYQKIFRNIFNQSLVVLVRDEASFENLKDIEVDINKVHISSDVVFAFGNDVEKPSNFGSKITSNPLKIAISVRHWNHFKTTDAVDGMNRFQKSIGMLAQYLVENYDADITFISTCQGIPDYWTDDSRVATEIAESLPAHIQKQINVDRKFHSPDELVDIFKSYDIVIPTRMHASILSLVANTPVFPIAYEFKTKELFRRLEMDEWIQDIEYLEQESLVTSIDNFIKELPEIKRKLDCNVKNETERALASAKIVKKALQKITYNNN